MTLIEATWHDARAAARALAAPLGAEAIPLHDAPGRTLASDARARCALPPFDTSAMDGWAVSGDGPWRIVGDALAGWPFRGHLEPGTCVRIATGAVVPGGTHAVVRSERASTDGATVRADRVPDAGGDIRRAGEECAVGELLASAGTVLSPAHVGLLAAAGFDHADVAVRPRVAVVTLGDELLDAGLPHDGRIRDALGPQLPSWLRGMGAQVGDPSRASDDRASAIAAIDAVVGDHDVIVTTGGTASGPRDALRSVIEELGDLVVDRVQVRPGHPMLLGCVRDVPVIGLPGNPHSALVGLATLAQPILAAMLGQPPAMARVPARDALHGAGGSTRLIAGTLVDGAFTGAPFTGSAMLRGLAQSSGFAVVPPEGRPAGALVDWLPFP